MFSTLNSKGNCFPNCAPGITHDTISCGFPPTSFFIASSYGFGMPQDPPTISFYGECNISEICCRDPLSFFGYLTGKHKNLLLRSTQISLEQQVQERFCELWIIVNMFVEL